MRQELVGFIGLILTLLLAALSQEFAAYRVYLLIGAAVSLIWTGWTLFTLYRQKVAKAALPYAALSNAELREKTRAVADGLRKLEMRYQKAARDFHDVKFAQGRADRGANRQISQQERDDDFAKQTAEINRISDQRKEEYHSYFHVEANQIYEELCRRLSITPIDVVRSNAPPLQDRTAFTDFAGLQQLRRGTQAGVDPLHNAAAALERMANSL